MADNLGNFVNRILKFCVSKFGATVPMGGTPGAAEAKLQAGCDRQLVTICTCLQNLEFRKAADALCALWTLGNQYIDEQAPWTLIKQDREAAAQVLRTCINLIRLYAIAASPFIPTTAQQLFDALHMTAGDRATPLSQAAQLDALPPGHPFDVPPVLFRKLEDSQIDQLRQQFGG